MNKKQSLSSLIILIILPISFVLVFVSCFVPRWAKAKLRYDSKSLFQTNKQNGRDSEPLVKFSLWHACFNQKCLITDDLSKDKYLCVTLRIEDNFYLILTQVFSFLSAFITLCLIFLAIFVAFSPSFSQKQAKFILIGSCLSSSLLSIVSPILFLWKVSYDLEDYVYYRHVQNAFKLCELDKIKIDLGPLLIFIGAFIQVFAMGLVPFASLKKKPFQKISADNDSYS